MLAWWFSKAIIIHLQVFEWPWLQLADPTTYIPGVSISVLVYTQIRMYIV